MLFNLSITGPADPNYDGPKPNIVIHPDDYPRYVNSATIYSRAIQKTKHVLYKNKYLAHRDKEQYPDHVTLWMKQRPKQRPWYHVHQCLDEKCPVHPGDVKLHKVMDANVDHELKAEPSFLCSYLKDKVDIGQFPYYKESIKTFYSSKSKENTKACGDITMAQNRRSLLALWHDPYCDGCERKDLHVGPVVEDKPRWKDELVIEDKPQYKDGLVAEDESRCEDEVIERDVFEVKDDISDILFKYRFLFSTEYLYGSSAKINLIKAKQEVNNDEKKESESSTVHTANANVPTKCEEHAESSVDQRPSVISTCVGQVPRTPARHYNNKRQFTPKYQTPYGSPFIKSNHGSYYTNTPSPYYTPSQSTLHLSPYNSRSPYLHTSRTTSPYSPTGIPYTSPYSATSALIYSPTAHQANRYLHGYPISNQFDYPAYASLQQYQNLSYRSYPYAQSPGLSTDYQSRFRQLYMMYNKHWNNTRDEYNRDHHQYEHDTNTDDYPDYESEDPLRTHESRHDDDRADEPRYSYDTEYRRPRSTERNYHRYKDRRYRTDTRRSRSPSRRERSPIDRHRQKRDRSPSSSSRKRHRTTHSCDTERYERRSARHSKSDHSVTSERSRHSRDSRSSSLKSVGKRKTSQEKPKSKNTSHRKSSKSREDRELTTEKPKSRDCMRKSPEKPKSSDGREKSSDRSKSKKNREKSTDRLKSQTDRSKSSDRSKSKTNSEKSSKKDRKTSSDKQESKRRS